MKKRLLSALLALCLMVSLMPTAWASGGTVDPPEGGDSGTTTPTEPDTPAPGTCGPNLKWAFNATNGLLTITGSGRMTDYTQTDHAPWFGNASNIKAIVIDAEVENLGNYALDECDNLKDIFFLGTTGQWDKVSTGEANDLTGISMHYGNAPCIISYDAGATENITGDMARNIVELNRPFTLPKCGFTRTDFNFRGWRINDSEEIYPAGYIYTVAGNTTLKAFWVSDNAGSKDYTITYRDVDGPIDPQYKSYTTADANQVLLLVTPERIGYTFLGWTYTLPDSTPVTTPNPGPIILPANTEGPLTFTANWKAINYTITVLDTDGTTELAKTTYNYKATAQTPEVTIQATKPGYTLAGVKELSLTVADNNVDGTVTSTRSGTTFWLSLPEKCIGNLDLEAEWDPVEYKITYDLAGGTASSTPGADAYTIENTAGLISLSNAPANPTKEGHTFKVWTCSVGGASFSDDLKSIRLPVGTIGDIILTAVWDPDTYVITYNGNSGTGDMTPGEATYGEPYTLPENGFTAPAGKQFGGWHIKNGAYDEKGTPIYTLDADGKPTSEIKRDFAAGEVCYFKDNTEISAIWKQIYTIKFDSGSQEASGTMQDVTRVEGDIYQLPACGFTAPEGQAFKAWQIASEEYIPYAPDAPEDAKNTYTLPPYTDGDPTDITITALWEDLYTITYKPGEGTGTDVTKEITETDGKTYKLPSIEDFNFTAPEGKHFTGWIIMKEGEDPTDEKGPGEEYVVGSDITVTAQWAAETYTITYEPNGGAGTMTAGTGTFWAQFELPGCGFTAPDGMQFDAWEVEGTRMAPGEKFRIMGDTTVKALWKKIGYSIEFVNGEDDEGNPVVVGTIDGKAYEDTVTLLESVPESDQPLKAWKIGASLYAPGNTFVMSMFAGEANPPDYKVTAEAVSPGEDEEPVTITYASGYTGNDAKEEQKVYADVIFGLPASCTFADPPAAEMTFAGWSKNGIGGAKFDETTDTAAADITFTALWEGKIVYELSGGTIGESAPKSYIYKEEGQDLDGRVTDPTRPGYVFEQWTLSDESVRLVNQEIKLPAGFKGTLTLTAHWKDDKNVFLVTFDPNGGTGEMAQVPVPKETEEGKDTTYPLPECTFVPPAGMEFSHWSLDGEKVEGTITLTKSITLKAEWKKKTDVDPDAKDCVVTYDPGEGTGEAIVEEGHKVGEWLKLPECTFTAPEGMEFDAWQKGEQKAAPGEEIYLDSAAVTVTALWKEKEPEPDDPTKPWTITFDANGGTGTMDPVTVPKAEGGTTYTLPACGFTAPEGKTFQAWKFDGKEYAPGAVITITGDTTITAVWKDAEVKPPKPTSWKITYNLNGGYMTGSGPTSYNLSDQAQTLNVPVPYKSGFTFLGWTYSGVSKPTKSVVIRANMTGDLTVVANWQMNPGAGGGNNTSQGYYISVSATAGGEIIIPWEYANQGAVVSVQARPQPGYEVGGVTVVNSQGFEVGDLKDLGGGNYSFTMPGYRVNVSATFKLQSAAAGPITRPVMNYEDVRLGDWFYDSVEYVYTRGMMSGVSATQFGPYGQATRGAIWTALAAHAGFDINGGATWYERGQYWAVNRGITDGESPSGTITREQLVTMLWRYKGSPVVFGGDLWQFTDGYAVSSYAMDAMRWAVSTGLIGGANGRLSPQASTTRAEAAAILARFCQS